MHCSEMRNNNFKDSNHVKFRKFSCMSCNKTIVEWVLKLPGPSGMGLFGAMVSGERLSI